jgi:hypothetical protein
VAQERVLATGPSTLAAGTNRSTMFLLPFELTDAVRAQRKAVDASGCSVACEG